MMKKKPLWGCVTQLSHLCFSYHHEKSRLTIYTKLHLIIFTLRTRLVVVSCACLPLLPVSPAQGLILHPTKDGERWWNPWGVFCIHLNNHNHLYQRIINTNLPTNFRKFSTTDRKPEHDCMPKLPKLQLWNWNMKGAKRERGRDTMSAWWSGNHS